jgi:hypothetical protein
MHQVGIHGLAARYRPNGKSIRRRCRFGGDPVQRAPYCEALGRSGTPIHARSTSSSSLNCQHQPCAVTSFLPAPRLLHPTSCIVVGHWNSGIDVPASNLRRSSFGIGKFALPLRRATPTGNGSRLRTPGARGAQSCKPRGICVPRLRTSTGWRTYATPTGHPSQSTHPSSVTLPQPFPPLTARFPKRCHPPFLPIHPCPLWL